MSDEKEAENIYSFRQWLDRMLIKIYHMSQNANLSERERGFYRAQFLVYEEVIAVYNEHIRYYGDP